MVVVIPKHLTIQLNAYGILVTVVRHHVKTPHGPKDISVVPMGIHVWIQWTLHPKNLQFPVAATAPGPRLVMDIVTVNTITWTAYGILVIAVS